MVTITNQNSTTKPVECIITCFEDGSIEIKDKRGAEINGLQEQEFFQSCQCKEITDIQQSIVDIKIVERDGTHCKVKKIGDTIYKIPCEGVTL